MPKSRSASLLLEMSVSDPQVFDPFGVDFCAESKGLDSSLGEGIFR